MAVPSCRSRISTYALPRLRYCSMLRPVPMTLDSPVGKASSRPLEASLQDCFLAFCGSGRCDMDGRTFAKLCRDCNILDKVFNATDADLLFSKLAPRSQRRLCFTVFQEALEAIAKKKSMRLDDVKRRIVSSRGPTLNGTVADAVRFHDDKSTYTGVHVNGGPDSVSKGTGTTTQLAAASMKRGF